MSACVGHTYESAMQRQERLHRSGIVGTAKSFKCKNEDLAVWSATHEGIKREEDPSDQTLARYLERSGLSIDRCAWSS